MLAGHAGSSAPDIPTLLSPRDPNIHLDSAGRCLDACRGVTRCLGHWNCGESSVRPTWQSCLLNLQFQPGCIFVFLIISANTVGMNHRLQAAGFAPPPPPCCESVLAGSRAAGGRGWDTEGTQRGHVGDAVPGQHQPPLSPPSHIHRVQEASPLTLPFPPVFRRATATFQSRGTPAASPQHPCPMAVCTLGFGYLRPPTAPGPKHGAAPLVTACWEPLALLQGPFANVNAFLSLESSADDLPERISHASPKIMPFAFPALETKRSPACRRHARSAARRCAGSRAGLSPARVGSPGAHCSLHTAPAAPAATSCIANAAGEVPSGHWLPPCPAPPWGPRVPVPHPRGLPLLCLGWG